MNELPDFTFYQTNQKTLGLSGPPAFHRPVWAWIRLSLLRPPLPKQKGKLEGASQKVTDRSEWMNGCPLRDPVRKLVYVKSDGSG